MSRATQTRLAQIADAADGAGENDTALAAAPRTYGVKARYRF